MHRRPSFSLLSLLAHAVLTQAVTFLMRPASTYQALELHVPAFLLGAIGACFAVVPLLIALPVGAIADRLGERFVMLTGSAFTVGAGVAFLIGGQSVAGLVLANALLGAGHLGCIVGQQTVVANTAETSELDSKFGYYTFASSLGQAIGPGIIALLAGTSVRPDTTPLFLAATVAASLLVVVTFGIARPGTGRTPSRPLRGGTLGLLRVPGLAHAVTTSAIIIAVVDLTVVYLPALGAERGLSASLVGALLGIRAVASMASRLLLGTTTLRFGRTRVMGGSIGLSAVALVAVAVPSPLVVLLVAVALLGLGLGVGQPLTMSWLIERAPADRRGRALSLRLAGNRVGQIVIPTVMGGVATAAGAGGVLIGAAVVVAGTLVLVRGVRLD